MVKIMLTRHGKTAWNEIRKVQGHSDIELTAEGVAQAELLAKNCPLEKVSAIYSSDLSRAKTTAEILAKKFNLPVQLEKNLREVNFGDLEGKTLAEFEKEDPQNFYNFFNKPDELKIKNAETFQELQARAFAAVKKIIAAHHDENIIIVAHGAINRVILCSILEIPIRKMWSLSQFNTAVNLIRCDDGFFTVDLINGTAHLS